MFVYSSRGKWVFPTLLPLLLLPAFHSWLLTWEVGLPHSPPTATFTSFPLLVAGRVLLLPSPAGLFVYSSGRDSPPPILGAQGAPPSLLPVFFVVVAYYSVFFLFSLGGGLSVQGAMLIWSRVVCVSTTYRFAHLVVHIFPSCLGAAVWRWPGSPPGFSI
jgi:hypothetical protein